MGIRVDVASHAVVIVSATDGAGRSAGETALVHCDARAMERFVQTGEYVAHIDGALVTVHVRDMQCTCSATMTAGTLSFTHWFGDASEKDVFVEALSSALRELARRPRTFCGLL